MSGFRASNYPTPPTSTLDEKPDKDTGLTLNMGNDKTSMMSNSSISRTYEAYNSKDFQKWQFKQAKILRERGKAEDMDREKSYIESMIRTVMRGYICHREVDEYSDCLVRRKLVDSSDLARAGPALNTRLAEQFCKSEVATYRQCMESKLNYETIVEAAIGHTCCDDLKVDMVICLEKHSEDRKAQETHCMRDYYSLMRCGLNNMFDEYWRKVSGFGTADEMHLYEVEQDHFKKQAVSKMKSRYGD
uniref:Uncharacterized protein n=1 Tax=Neobodo designis TaxID=312471 RepID=A0A7S1M0R8_NEODS